MAALFFLTLGLIAFSSSPARALGCDCGSMSALLSRTAQTIVSGIAQPVMQMIEKAAGYQTVNLHEDLTAIREAIILAQEETAGAIERAEQNEADRISERTYEPASQPLTSCQNDLMGGIWREGSSEVSRLGGDILSAVSTRRNRHDRPAGYLAEINSGRLDPAGFGRLLGQQDGRVTLTAEEFKLAGEMLGELTDPLPAPKLPESLSASPAGQLYNAFKGDLENRLGLYQGILAQRLAQRAPLIGGLSEWTAQKWQDMGGQNEPPGLIDGFLSENSLQWYLTNMRLGSANWHEKILPALPEAGLLREMAGMMAVQLELSRRQNAALETLTLLMALEGLDRLDQKNRPALRSQYRLALGARE
jgi:hypothetical protein